MHELLAIVEDATYQRIVEDARIKGITPQVWINEALGEIIRRRQSARKEVLPEERENSESGGTRVHAEVYSPHPERESHELVGQLQQRIRDLETERDNLNVLLAQKTGSEYCVPAEETELITLNYEIKKCGLELDEMETVRERFRIEKDQLLNVPGANPRIQHLEKEISRQEYEIENFRKEIAKIMATRDSIRAEMAKKRRE